MPDLLVLTGMGQKEQGDVFFVIMKHLIHPIALLRNLSTSKSMRELSFMLTGINQQLNTCAYFQAYSNTYASLEYLKKTYVQAIQNKDVMGLIIGTRPDCVDEPIMEYLADLSKEYYVVIEFGIESIYNETLKLINRGHNFQDSLVALDLAQKYGVKCGAHFMFGLPGETRSQMMESVKTISTLPLHTVKFHQLQIIRATQLAEEFKRSPSSFDLFSLEDYIEFLCEFLSFLNPAFVIERLAAETQPWNNMSETWGGLRYDQVLRRIENRMEELDLWQGKNYTENVNLKNSLI